ncbi:hypothetical protein C464_05355 [Halorubrum coriense DSM 10284]|uniref:Uncharacterized protein n=2 Tax=Halorubrum coriense TaxID=64713 RepID=M0ENY8_9EURY|nr:hypothetical protein C464_05355 [Halorubrum coriense DSM 10284]
MLLPFAGIYPSMVATGALSSLPSSVALGVVVFGGPAAVAIVLTELTTDRKRGLQIVGLIGVVQLPAAALTATIATASRAVLWVDGFAVLTMLVLFVIAFEIVNSSTPQWVPSLLTIGCVLICLLLLDVAVSVASGEVTLLLPGDGVVDWVRTVVITERVLILRSVVAALAGLSVVAATVVCGPVLLGRVIIQRFKIGCAIALCLIGLEVASVVTDAPTLTIIAVSLVLAVDVDNLGGE